MARLITTVALAALLAVPAAAAAQESTVAPASTTFRPSPSVARALSGVGTVVPVGMVALSVPADNADILVRGLLLLTRSLDRIRLR